MEIVIKGKQGEGKSLMLQRMSLDLKGEGCTHVISSPPPGTKLNKFIMASTGRLPYTTKKVGCLVIDGIPKGNLRLCRKAVKAAHKAGRQFSTIYVIQK
ncbi:hypothetical protein SAMN05192529_13152 [Arachidicoccus rhizosphaerae]|uniref:Uncharacterized protein n=1 Tax=Arachidicoccus rhizosphaerae TaxID=551991 RepID=A0A1H4CGU3_9BACT|nr:hypothetical protein [Arachidicoccus rhizosphaerae]SEA59646.1 hypothetical protein SAMN05192529_13152 [Arachidicoccus rhizosphaerae]